MGRAPYCGVVIARRLRWGCDAPANGIPNHFLRSVARPPHGAIAVGLSERQPFAGAAVLLSVERVEFSAAVDPESVSGFGPLTAQATRRFQRSAGIQVDGVVGPETRAAMRGGPDPAGGTLRRGDRGPEVRTLQQRLRTLRYWVGPIDGVYGELTQQAVTAFQKVNGLTRDGVAGAAVGDALASPRRFEPRSTRPGLVMEVDEATQVLVAVIDGNVADTWNTSTGTEDPYFYEGRRHLADTPNGE